MICRRLISLFYTPPSNTETRILKEKIAAAVQETNKVSERAQDVAIEAEAGRSALQEVSEATRERLALLDAQRRLRTRNPTVTTATEALKLLERR